MAARSRLRAAVPQDGVGDVDFVKAKIHWSRSGGINNIEKVLMHLRNMLAKPEFKKLAQPADGQVYG